MNYYVISIFEYLLLFTIFIFQFLKIQEKCATSGAELRSKRQRRLLHRSTIALCFSCCVI